MPDRLNARQKDALLNSLEMLYDRKPGWFVWGPTKRAAVLDLYDALQAIAVGYYAEYYEPDKGKKGNKNGLPEEILVYVSHKQAEKLSKVLAALGVDSEKERAAAIKKREDILRAEQEKKLQEMEDERLRKEEELKEAKKERLRKARQKKQRTTTRKVKAQKTTVKPLAQKTSRWDFLKS